MAAEAIGFPKQVTVQKRECHLTWERWGILSTGALYMPLNSQSFYTIGALFPKKKENILKMYLKDLCLLKD